MKYTWKQFARDGAKSFWYFIVQRIAPWDIKVFKEEEGVKMIIRLLIL